MDSISEQQIDFNSQTQSVDDLQQEDSWLKYLPVIFRSLGALAVLISLYTFLARGWDSGSDLTRYLIFIGHTVALAIVGLINGKFIREAKGARLLIILALVSIPINFSILGSFIFAGSHASNLIDYPFYMIWSVGSLKTALLIAGAALVVMIPICSLGFKVLSRNISTKASLLFLLSNIVLLVPFRQPMVIAFLSIVVGVGLFVFYNQYLRKELALRTMEGKIAFFLQFMPITILLGRSFWLYQFDSILVTSASFILFAAVRHISLLLQEGSLKRIGLEILSIGLTLICALSFGYSLMLLSVALEIIIGLTTLIAAGMFFELSLRGDYRAPGYRMLATVIALTGLLANFWLHTTLLSALIVLIAGIAMLFVSYMYQQKALFIGGLILVISGLYYQITLLGHLFEMNYWFVLTGLGILLIVSGSFLEGNAQTLKLKLRKTRSQLADWQY